MANERLTMVEPEEPTEWVLASQKILGGLLLLVSGGYVIWTGEALPEDIRNAIEKGFNTVLLGLSLLIPGVALIVSRVRQKTPPVPKRLTALPKVLRK